MNCKKTIFKFFFLFILFFGVFGLVETSWAATINATSCSRDHVQTAINSAVAGDTVVIPSGTCTWSSGVNISKNITVRGAGNTSTVINPSSATVSQFNIYGPVRISQIGFANPAFSKTNANINASGRGWRVDNVRMVDGGMGTSGGYGIIVRSSSYPDCSAGLIDNSTFIDARIAVGCTNSIQGQHDAYAYDEPLGTLNAVYIENNTLTRNGFGNIVDSNRGGRYVARYNTVTGQIMAHGRGTNTYERGTRSWEVYNNTFTGVTGSQPPLQLRSGTGVIFGNTVSGIWSWSDKFLLSSDRSHSDYGQPCDGTSPMDGNMPGQNGYICRDQAGAGKDTVRTIATGNWTSDGWAGTIAWQAQTSDPVYGWNNNKEIIPNGNTGIHIKENRDFYDSYPNTAQTSRTSPFNGASGVGFGTLANRPSSCTTGVAYWATDAANTNWNTANGSGNDGCLYKCANNAWSSACSYVPFTYPHPLRGGTVTPYCGDSSCNNAETCSTCPSDCGSCPGGNAPIITIVSPQANSNVSCSSDPFRINLQVATNVAATCRNCVAGSTCNSSTVYANMANFATTGNTTTHTSSPQVGCGASNITYYIRCSDTAGNTNQTSTILNFNTVYSSNTAPSAPTGVRVI